MREKLIELLDDIQQCGEDFTEYEIYGMRLPNTVSNEAIADHLIQNGVTIQKLISVTERLPQRWVSVLGYMTDAGAFPPVRECFVTMKDEFYFPALSETRPVSHWTPLPEPPNSAPDNNVGDKVTQTEEIDFDYEAEV